MIGSIIGLLKSLLSKDKHFYRQIKSKFGFYPGQTYLYHIALTHRSSSFRENNGTLVNNERLEFLGDAVLGSIMADFLFKHYPKEDEGFLTQMRSKIVKREFLNKIALDLGFDHLLGVSSQHFTRKNLFGNALEAFIGAIYLDRGYEFTRHFILSRVIRDMLDLEEIRNIDTNFKSQLLEWAQRNKKDMVITTDPESTNPERFISSIRIDNEVWGTGTGFSKKEAEQRAAEEALQHTLLNGD